MIWYTNSFNRVKLGWELNVEEKEFGVFYVNDLGTAWT